MAKKHKAIYAPGELNRVREKLGDIDQAEAKRVAELLGGEIGYERTEEMEAARSKRPLRREKVEMVVDRGPQSRRPGRRIDVPLENIEEGRRIFSKSNKRRKPDLSDDPSVALKTGYFERVKMDQFAGQVVFEIKSSTQVLVSVLSFFRDPTDYVNPRFVNKRMNDYYGKIEQLVNSTRTLFPRNNAKRNNQVRRISPFVYTVLDNIRNWGLERIGNDLAVIQAHPRSARVSEFADILRAVYKPLFIFENLDLETHIKGSYKLLYKILYIESPMEAKEKYQDIIRNALAAFSEIRRDVQFCLYPLLMKHISDRWIPYERFFIERRRRYLAFLGVSEHEQIHATELTPQQIENVDVDVIKEEMAKETPIDAGAEGAPEEDPNDPKVIARKAREEGIRAERKALERGENALEALFPQAGWDKLEDFPDLYPYFADVYNLRRGFELIAPTDPMQQISVLMHIQEDLFYGLRYVKFGSVEGPDGVPVNVDDNLGDVINNWRRFIDLGLAKEYLPRLVEYCRILENSSESRTSPFMRKTANELHWVKRLYFLPYYKFESVGPPPFQKQDVTPVYGQIRKLRKYLTAVAMGIEQGAQNGGAEAKAICHGINNPWESYNFEVPNPVSKRLDMLLAPAKRNNASLVFFSLSTTAVLDYIINNEDSWSYGGRPGPLFRSIKGEGITPMFGVDSKLDADQIFRDAMKKKE
ncbi:MAG: hypothetical protein FWG99_04605 [Treponema sp.]|nr:hypothetical protein [Treponema sp.]